MLSGLPIIFGSVAVATLLSRYPDKSCASSILQNNFCFTYPGRSKGTYLGDISPSPPDHLWVLGMPLVLHYSFVIVELNHLSFAFMTITTIYTSLYNSIFSIYNHALELAALPLAAHTYLLF